MFSQFLGEDVLVELRQHDDYISGKNLSILRTFKSLGSKITRDERVAICSHTTRSRFSVYISYQLYAINPKLVFKRGGKIMFTLLLYPRHSKNASICPLFVKITESPEVRAIAVLIQLKPC